MIFHVHVFESQVERQIEDHASQDYNVSIVVCFIHYHVCKYNDAQEYGADIADDLNCSPSFAAASGLIHGLAMLD